MEVFHSHNSDPVLAKQIEYFEEVLAYLKQDRHVSEKNIRQGAFYRTLNDTIVVVTSDIRNQYVSEEQGWEVAVLGEVSDLLPMGMTQHLNKDGVLVYHTNYASPEYLLSLKSKMSSDEVMEFLEEKDTVA